MLCGLRCARRRLVHRAGGRLTGDRRAQRVQQHQQAPPAGVHHTGVAEHVELLGGLFQRDNGRVAGGGDRPGQPVRVGALLDGVGGGPQHRDDGPRDLLAAHRGDDQLDAALQRGPEEDGVDIGQCHRRSRPPRSR